MLRALLLRRKIEQARGNLAAVQAEAEQLQTREAEIETAISEITENSTDEERAAVDAAVADHETAVSDNATRRAAIEAEIAELETELAALEETTRDAGAHSNPENPGNHHERGEIIMNTRTRFCDWTMEQRSAFVETENIKTFVENVRGLLQHRGITNGNLTFPDTVLELIRAEIETTSKLLPYVNVRRVNGTARQPVMGEIPEAVWTELCANINEIDLILNIIDLDAFKVGAFVPVCNWLIDGSAIDIVDMVVTASGVSIRKALDMALLFGTGVKMPLGFVTRLAQTSQPESWGPNYPAWEDLHTSNILSLNIQGQSGTAFFVPLVAAIAAAKPGAAGGEAFWVMNRKTHLDIMAKAMAFNASGALVAGATDTMPIIGGRIIEMESPRIADYTIYGGYGKNYTLAERSGSQFSRFDQTLAIQDMTLFIAKAAYDGFPVGASSFVAINYNNTDAPTTHDFAPDYANTGLNVLTVTAAAGTASGDTVLTVSGTVAQSAPTLRYKVGATVNGITTGAKVVGWTSLTSGTTQITAAAGTPIAVAELDAAGRVISVGSTVSVPKT